MAMGVTRAAERLSLPRLLAFAAPGASVGALFLPLTIFLPPLYAELGLELALVGTIFLLARAWDGVTDPVLGALADRFGGRFGRRRPWIVASVPILGLAIYRVFVPPPDPSALYLLGWMFVLYVGWTMLTISHVAWASELSDDYDERSRIMGVLQVLTMLGGLSVLVVAATLEMQNAASSLPERMRIVAAFILVPLPLLVALAVASGHDEPRPSRTRGGRRQGLWTLFAHRSLRRLVLADLFIGIQIGAHTSLHVFYVSHVLAMPDRASVYVVASILSGLLFVPFWVRASYRLGKHRTLCASAALGCLAALAIGILPAERFALGLFAYVAIGVYFGSRELLMRSMMADVVLEDTTLPGADADGRAGIFYALLTLTAKIGAALAVGITFGALAAIGFETEGTNPPEVLSRFRWLVGGVPVATCLGVIAMLWRFPIDAARQRELRAQLETRRAGAPATA
jgi:Na+/melibiose symporter-like transporter